MADAWVLRLKDDAKEEGMVGDFYYDPEENDTESIEFFLTQNLNKAAIYEDKEQAIEELKLYEKIIFDLYGENAICNGGYTNIMKNFEWVEVEVEFPESAREE